MLITLIIAFLISSLLPISFYIIPVLLGKSIQFDRKENIGMRMLISLFVSVVLLIFHLILSVFYYSNENLVISNYYTNRIVITWPNYFLETFYSILLTLFLNTVLFSIPIIHNLNENGISFITQLLKNFFLIDEEFWDNSKSSKNKKLETIRNYWAGPIVEEIIYRMVLIQFIYQFPRELETKGMLPTHFQAISISSLLFGISHLHHIWQRIIYDGLSIKNAFIISIFQMIYTTVFGLYTGYLYLRTNSVISCFVLHVYCNLMGFPDFVSIVKDEKYGKIYTVGLFISVGLFFTLFYYL